MRDRVKTAEEVLERRVDGLAVLAEAVHRRHNVSAILRSAEAFGLHEACLVAGHFRPSRSASKGAERWMDLRVVSTLEEAMAPLRARGFRLYVADIGEGALSPEEVPVDQPLAVLFGSELAGVSPEAKAIADGIVTVPCVGVTRFLNVSVAAGVILHTLARRRAAVATGIRGERARSFVEAIAARDEAWEAAQAVLWAEGGEGGEEDSEDQESQG